jgi:hypothetical protein
MSSFTATLKAFCDELRLTFPELETTVSRAAALTAPQFWSSWQNGLTVLVARDEEALLKGARAGFLLGPVRLTSEVWAELSVNTKGAIWRYLRTLTLESAMAVGIDGLDTESMQALMAIISSESLEQGGQTAEAETNEIFSESMKNMGPLIEKLKGLLGAGAGSGGFMDLSGFTMPEIPERLRYGRIAKLAEEMAKQFNPAEFGIDPTLLSGTNVEEILARLAEMYKKDPTLLVGGAKKMAERIKTQILGGSLNREELIGEAQEFINLFKEHPQFKDIIGKVSGLMGPGGLAEMFGGGSSAEPSERRRAVQERLRKKLAARTAAASGGAGGPPK